MLNNIRIKLSFFSFQDTIRSRCNLTFHIGLDTLITKKVEEGAVVKFIRQMKKLLRTGALLKNRKKNYPYFSTDSYFLRCSITNADKEKKSTIRLNHYKQFV